jgi:hypothetical protein
MPVLYFLLALAVIGVVAYVSHKLAEARRRELAAYAAEQGWSFFPERVRDMDDRYPAFGCLNRGHGRFAHNVMTGKKNGLPLVAFDYRYVTGHGKNRRTHRFSALIVQPPLRLQPLFIRHENLLDKLTEFVGLDDIDFESAEFSREFYVKAQDRRWAYDVIHPRMMEFLLQAPRFNLQLDRRHIIAWRGSRFSGPDFTAACGVVQGMLDRLPEYLKQQQGAT